MPGLKRSDERGPRRSRRLFADRRGAVVWLLALARHPHYPRHPRYARHGHTARVVSATALVAVMAAILLPLALPNRAGITRATAKPRDHAPSAGTAGTAPTAGTAGTAAHPSPRNPAGPAASQASVTVAAGAPTVPVPGSWFGISTEYWALPVFEENTPVFERVLSLLHAQGDGPLVLRIGGDSADHSFWSPKPRRMPSWAFALTPSFVSRLRALVLRDHVRLIVDLNLITDTPLTAAAWAKAAETALPKGSIVGFEIGNEPDLYSRRYWETMITRSPFETTALPVELTPSTYVSDFAAYARVLGGGSLGIPLIGPAAAHPRVSADYMSTLVEDERSELGAVTAHLYPYSACVKNRLASSFPSVPRLLSRAASAGLTKDVAKAVAIAHGAGLKFRLTELNSVTCGGKPGVSNTFATALWAPDALFTLLRAGVDGANLHVRADAINAPFVINRGGLYARPLLYGLMLFNRTLGPQARLVRVRESAPRSLNLSAWAVRVRGGALHVLLMDKSARTVRFDLHLPASGPATVQRLLAPSPYSRSGVTLDGQRLNYAGDWIGTRRTATIAPGPRGGYEVTLPRHSAALVAVSLRGRARRSAARRGPAAFLEHHRRVAVAKHAVLAVGLHRTRKH